MRILVVEDDFTSRQILSKLLSQYGDCDVAVDGEEAIYAFEAALDENRPYQLICMDIMMPKVDGYQALKEIRKIEQISGRRGDKEAKVIMTTAVGDPKSVIKAYYESWVLAYMVKPINPKELFEIIRNSGLSEC